MQLADWINAQYLDEDWRAQAQQRYLDATPYPHMQLEDFLQEEKYEALVDALSDLEFAHKENDLFSLAQTPDLKSVDDKTIQSFIDFMNSQQLRDWFADVTGEQTTPGKLDCFGAIYEDSDYLLCHDDRLEDRKIAFILYLTTLTEEQGGALALFTDSDGLPNKKAKAYQPVANSIAFFTVNKKSWHEVEEVTDDTFRVSAGGWLLC